VRRFLQTYRKCGLPEWWERPIRIKARKLIDIFGGKLLFILVKNTWSLIACLVIGAMLLQTRCANISHEKDLNVTTWDAFGYYVYLPAIFIYKDYKKLDWLDSIDKKYDVTGGNGWQAIKLENGNYTFKYLGGVALMEMPLFLLGHFIASNSHYPADGFSAPYQYALSFGIILYSILALFLLRSILRRFFSDGITAVTLVLLTLASNYPQYAAVDSGQSHASIFVLYVLVLYTTTKWHERPKIIWAVLTGYLIGLATMSRPTEAIMFLIPLLWQTQNKEAAQHKWALAGHNKTHVAAAIIAGLCGILPQLIYWKLTTGSLIYDVGSKWVFLNPYFRVLVGWEKGWFIYTPVTILFVAGLFFVKRFPFKNSVIWFCVLNIWIIMAWSDWRYGGSYSTRALVQSYPVFALPLAAVTERINKTKGRFLFYLLCSYLVGVNIFQLYQYSKTILHFNDMNRRYYGRIYLNPDPTPLDMSLLDTDEMPGNEKDYKSGVSVSSNSTEVVHFSPDQTATLIQMPVSKGGITDLAWIRIEASIQSKNLWQSYLNATLQVNDSVKHVGIRLFSPISKDGEVNQYAFYIKVPPYFRNGELRVYLSSGSGYSGTVKHLSITALAKKD